MKRVITYGTFDLFHKGHYALLERAKKLGNYLIVGITTEYYDASRGKLNVVDSLLRRIENIKKTGLADEIIIEDHDGQKLEDVIKYNIDLFVIGSDWKGEFDFLKEYCEVLYLDRTKEVSSTLLRYEKFPIIRLGIIGSGRIAKRFPSEVKYVSGVNLNSVYNPHIQSAKEYSKEFLLNLGTDDIDLFYDSVDAVIIASPHETHFEYIMSALRHKKHVLCEKPLVLRKEEARDVYGYAKSQGLIVMEAIKTAYAPGFNQIIRVARSGIIGNIRDIEAAFTKLARPGRREMMDERYGGAFTELSSYCILPIFSLLGYDYNSVHFESLKEEKNIDFYTKAFFRYDKALATVKVGLGVKSEGQLLISGTKGYILVKSPWWLTRSFDICFEDRTKNQTINAKFAGDGLRYEVSELVRRINQQNKTAKANYDDQESIAAIGVIEAFQEQK